MSLRENAHSRVVSALARADADAAEWCAWVRLDVERRLGDSCEDRVLDDDEYGAALDAFGLIRETLEKVRRVGA
jgi:hypothetical protein